jgi:hypothetical protein
VGYWEHVFAAAAATAVRTRERLPNRNCFGRLSAHRKVHDQHDNDAEYPREKTEKGIELIG